MITHPPPLSQALAAASESSGGESSGFGLSNLEAALKMTDLTSELEKLTEKGFTIFAPIDNAWDASTKTAAEADLQELLENHVRRSDMRALTYSLPSITRFTRPLLPALKQRVSHSNLKHSLVRHCSSRTTPIARSQL